MTEIKRIISLVTLLYFGTFVQGQNDTTIIVATINNFSKVINCHQGFIITSTLQNDICTITIYSEKLIGRTKNSAPNLSKQDDINDTTIVLQVKKCKEKTVSNDLQSQFFCKVQDGINSVLYGISFSFLEEEENPETIEDANPRSIPYNFNSICKGDTVDIPIDGEFLQWLNKDEYNYYKIESNKDNNSKFSVSILTNTLKTDSIYNDTIKIRTSNGDLILNISFKIKDKTLPIRRNYTKIIKNNFIPGLLIFVIGISLGMWRGKICLKRKLIKKIKNRKKRFLTKTVEPALLSTVEIDFGSIKNEEYIQEKIINIINGKYEGVNNNYYCDITPNERKSGFKIKPKIDIEEGEYNQTIKIETSNGTVDLSVHFIKSIYKVVSLSTVEIDFGTIKKEEDIQEQTIIISNGEFISVEINNYFVIIPNEDKISFNIKPRSDLNAGKYDRTIKIKTNNGCVDLRVNLTVEKEFLPSLLLFTCDNLTSTSPLGFIADKLKPNYMDGIFVIQFKEGSMTANLSINDSKSAQKRVFGSIEDTLNQACEKYETVRGGKQIITIKEGVLVNEDGIWVIKEKIEIEIKA